MLYFLFVYKIFIYDTAWFEYFFYSFVDFRFLLFFLFSSITISTYKSVFIALCFLGFLNLNPVSYIHLDVYKRQIIIRTLLITTTILIITVEINIGQIVVTTPTVQIITIASTDRTTGITTTQAISGELITFVLTCLLYTSRCV